MASHGARRTMTNLVYSMATRRLRPPIQVAIKSAMPHDSRNVLSRIAGNSACANLGRQRKGAHVIRPTHANAGAFTRVPRLHGEADISMHIVSPNHTRSPTHLIQSLAQDGRLCVRAQSKTVHHASTESNDILQRATHLGTSNVTHKRDVKILGLEQPLQQKCMLTVVVADHSLRQLLSSNAGGNIGAHEHRAVNVEVARNHLGDYLRSLRPDTHALDQRDCHSVALGLANQLLADAADKLVGRTKDEHVCILDRGQQVRVGNHVGAQVDTRQVPEVEKHTATRPGINSASNWAWTCAHTTIHRNMGPSESHDKTLPGNSLGVLMCLINYLGQLGSLHVLLVHPHLDFIVEETSAILWPSIVCNHGQRSASPCARPDHCNLQVWRGNMVEGTCASDACYSTLSGGCMAAAWAASVKR
eukprot:365734-Chlamydomonas_euryale.AAC.28